MFEHFILHDSMQTFHILTEILWKPFHLCSGELLRQVEFTVGSIKFFLTIEEELWVIGRSVLGHEKEEDTKILLRSSNRALSSGLLHQSLRETLNSLHQWRRNTGTSFLLWTNL